MEGPNAFAMFHNERGSAGAPKLLFSPPFVLLSILGDTHTEKHISICTVKRKVRKKTPSDPTQVKS